jgi:hypothetical protein
VITAREIPMIGPAMQHASTSWPDCSRQDRAAYIDGKAALIEDMLSSAQTEPLR